VKEKKERKTFWPCGDFLVWYFAMLFAPLGMLFIMKTLEYEGYVVIKAL